MQRVWVVGSSGSGKTTVARTLGRGLGLPHVELDAIYHQAGWEPLGLDAFRAQVAAQVAAPGWVVDGNYSDVADLVAERADTIVWLDLPRARVMRQIATRTARRIVLRQELWNGNREPLLGWLSRDPEKSIMLWAWQTHGTYAERYAPLADRSSETGQAVVRLRSQRDVAVFLAGATSIAPG